MEQTDEPGREKLSSVHQYSENGIPESVENALPPIDEQIPENVLEAVSLVLEGVSRWERELREKGGRDDDGPKSLLRDKTMDGERDGG